MVDIQLKVFLTLYTLSVPIFLVCDFLWLGFFAKNFYKVHMGSLMGRVMWSAAVAFYAIFIFGLTFFASYPAVLKGSAVTAMLFGGMFGFFTYATYDLTNLAVLRTWSLRLTIVDILWGTFLGAFVSTLAVIIRNVLI